MSEMMRAVWYEQQGPAREVLRIGEVPRPSPGHGEVLVRLAASGVNPHDTKSRSGWTGRPMAHPRIIPHGDGAGTIVDVGAGVDRARMDERVWVFRADHLAGHGAAAEYAAVMAGSAVSLPDEVPFEVGAGIGIPALTAYAAVFTGGPVTGRTVLVQGGAGAVAAYAIQFARWNGARVIATVSSDEKARIATDMGADEVIDYKREDVVERVLTLTCGRGVDRIVEVDLGANLPVDIGIVAPHAVIASYSSSRVREPVLPYYLLAPNDVTIRFVQGMILADDTRRDGATLIGQLMLRGALKHPATHAFAFEACAAAHEALEGGITGKVIVRSPAA
jgi:NADPH:quinone reductase-like Zn-dependent oxidoreductase